MFKQLRMETSTLQPSEGLVETGEMRVKSKNPGAGILNRVST